MVFFFASLLLSLVFGFQLCSPAYDYVGPVRLLRTRSSGRLWRVFGPEDRISRNVGHDTQTGCVAFCLKVITLSINERTCVLSPQDFDVSQVGMIFCNSDHEFVTVDGLSNTAFHHHALDLCNGLRRIETLGTGLGAVHDRVAAIKSERILKIVQTLARRLVAAVDKPAIGLE